MPKRKRRNGVGPSRKSARLEERLQQPRLSAPTQQGALPSPLTSGSLRGDVSRMQAASHHRFFPLDSGKRKKWNDTEFKTEFAKPASHPFGSTAGRKGKNEKASAHSRERVREPDLGRLRPKKQTLLENSAPEQSVRISKRSVRSQRELGVSEQNAGNNTLDSISHWAIHGAWPEGFPAKVLMTSSGNSGKRPRTSSSQSGKFEKPRSYSQSRKDGEVPEQYTSEYERHIFTKGLDMDLLRGEEHVSEQSKNTCIGFMRITRHSVKPTIFPTEQLRKVINLLGNRNEAIINRDVTPMIIPPLTSLYFNGENHLEHIVDEVNADWYEQCVLEGPRIRPDLAIGLYPSTFTEGEIDKLKRYKSVDNWAQFTGNMYFPFLMCEVKCGREGLDTADRQNMHSCCVAVRTVLRIEQEADKYRAIPELERLSGKILVFSISHNPQDVRLYGHYAIIQEEKWTYYRYRIGTFNILTSQKDLLTLYNFVQSVLKVYVPNYVKQLKDAISALPEPSTISFTTSGMSMNENYQYPQERDEDGFVVPAIPGASRSKATAEFKTNDDRLFEQLARQNEQLTRQNEQLARQNEHISKLMEQLEIEKQENKAQMEQLRQDSKGREKGLERQMEEQRKQMEEQRKQMEEQQKEIMSLLKK